MQELRALGRVVETGLEWLAESDMGEKSAKSPIDQSKFFLHEEMRRSMWWRAAEIAEPHTESRSMPT